MNCLITGCGGFVGSHLAEFLLARELTVYGMVHHNRLNVDHLKPRLNIVDCDMLDKERLQSIVTELRPDFIFHLAAQSLILSSWQDPEKTIRVNVLGTVYLLESVRQAGIDPLVEIAGSSGEYGFVSKDEIPIKETRELHPTSPYGVSKVAEDMLARLYWQAYRLRIITVRPFHIIGPRKSSDACSDFARGIVQIEAGQKDSLSVGNLETVRDMVDVRDAAAAAWLLAEKGAPGEVYNICSGTGRKIKDVLDKMISLSRKPVKVCPAPNHLRPYDEPVLVGDSSKLRDMGWKPEIPIERTLSDILEYWRTSTARV